MDPWSGQRLTVAGFDRQLSTDIARLQEAVRELTQDQAVFRDPARLRARLRQYELDDEPGELEAMQAMMEITTMLGDSGPTRRRYWTVGLYAIMLVDKGATRPRVRVTLQAHPERPPVLEPPATPVDWT